MTTRRLSARIFALLAAYAFVLQGVLLSVTLTAHVTGHTPLTLAVICTATPDGDQPAGPDQPPCALHCLMAACSHSGVAPHAGAIAFTIIPSKNRISLLRPIETLGRAIAKNPQIPRAPPFA